MEQRMKGRSNWQLAKCKKQRAIDNWQKAKVLRLTPLSLSAIGTTDVVVQEFIPARRLDSVRSNLEKVEQEV